MSYEEWINKIDKLKDGYIDNTTLKILQNTEINYNVNDMIIPKLEELIKTRFEKSVNKIIKNLNEIFNDINYLDLALVNFKKEINFISQLILLKQIPNNKKEEIFKSIKIKTEKVYEILTTEALNIDTKGTYLQIICNNKIKWSDINEL